MKHIAAYGNIAEGFKLVGPFDSPKQAQDYMLAHSEEDYYNLLPLEEPETEFMSPAFPVPAYSIGHRFFVMDRNRVVEAELVSVNVYWAKAEHDIIYTCSILDNPATGLRASEAQMAMTTKQKLLDSL